MSDEQQPGRRVSGKAMLGQLQAMIDQAAEPDKAIE
jgi:hypothetical protein